MTDTLIPSQRSSLMARVKARDTLPERVVRSQLHRMGYRFRLQRKDLPGKPDIVLPKYRVAIFVHGCFWHSHEGCPRGKRPSTNIDFWNDKLDRNVERDQQVQEQLKDLAWTTHIVWECELKNRDLFVANLSKIMEI